MGKFLYVFDRSSRDAMLKLGYELLTSDENNTIYVFKNSEKLCFNLEEICVVPSDTLML